jgi:diacylglycerol kinase
LIKHEHNARIHLLATSIGVVLGFVFGISATEWIAILFCIGLMFSLELINTAIELLADEVTDERRPSIKAVKDLSAAAVLVGAFVSTVIGAIVFLPKIWSCKWLLES